MKCKYCGGNLDLENKFCPNCGRPNELAQQHIRDMEHFRGEFDRTQEDVYRHTSRWSGIFVRAIILAVIAVAFFVCAFITQNAYSFRMEFMEQKADRHFAEYSAQLDRYLEERDYRSFSSYFDYLEADVYGSEYTVYTGLKWPADCCCRIQEQVMRIVFPAPYGDQSHYYEYLAEDLSRFYEYTELSFYRDKDMADPETVAVHWERMERTINELLVTYLGFTEEETASLRSMSEARRALLLEERIQAVSGN